ncbi:MAG: hypothetical protein ABI091_03070 [Ferruginibacter sp.]
MKKIIILLCMCICIAPAQAQLLKKLKDKVNKTVDKTINKATGTDSPKTETEKKEDAASDQYSDVTENNERPIFVDAAPSNGKMVLKLKKGDLFWGGYIFLKGQPKKGDTSAKVLDFINARVGSLFNLGEMSSNAIYFDGKRLLNDPQIIPLRPEFISYDINTTPFFTSTKDTSLGGFDPAGAMALMQANGNKRMTDADIEAFKKKATPTIKPPTFSFNYNGKVYGPFTGSGEKMWVLKSMTDGKPTTKFYGIGNESVIGDDVWIMNALIQTENGVVRVQDHMIIVAGSAELSYPTGSMAFVPGGKVNTFSNGKTVPIIKVAGIENSVYNVVEKGGKYFSEMYGTDSGHVVCIVSEIDKINHSPIPPVEAIIDYKTKLKYPVEIAKKNLLIARNPSKSVLYKMHTLYYPDGTKETIDNVGDAQLVNFNGKEYIVWFEMKKAADGHEIYVCQKELK